MRFHLARQWYTRLAGLSALLLSFSLCAADGQWDALYELNMQLAAKGSLEAQYKLGEMSEEGRGTPVDLKAALSWYEKAAARKHSGAMYKIGLFHEEGKGVAANPEAAKSWYQKAAEKGHYLAKMKLQRLNRVQEGQSAAEAAEIERARAEEEKLAREEMAKRLREEREQARKATLAKQRAEQEKRAQREAALKQERAKKEAAQQKPSQGSVRDTKQVETTPVQKEEGAPVDGKGGSFKSDPCKSAAAKYLSTCR